MRRALGGASVQSRRVAVVAPMAASLNVSGEPERGPRNWKTNAEGGLR
jgi:hypothetical protein